MIKLEDVAKKAGVSVTTASRVINRKGYLSEKTIAKVEGAMRDLHYSPNAAARSLQGKSLKLIGLVFPTIKNIFYAELIEKIEQGLFKKGYKAMLATTEHEEEKEREYLALLLSNQVDGIIYGSHNLTTDDYTAIEAPIVAFDRLLTADTTVVSSDNLQGGKLATQTLIKLGCQNIAIFTGNDNTNSPTRLRREGYLSVLTELKLNAHVIKIPSELSVLRKQAEIQKVLSENDFDGVFCTDDLTALLVKQRAQKMNQNLHVVGFDGTEYVENYHPDLTTIKQPISDLAELLVDLLIRKIKGESVDKSYQLPVKLHYGE
ncbi:LacI family DNA-binding transcriptional regulator [Lactococcus hircilactis]|uniref:LacI family DNA-binding transcriptional regulator n=1 Tax=Lactococcus hircilactis TaxID=1494462 RepID=UPI003FA3413B